MNRPGGSAFSLIEVVLALAVMAFALVAVVGLFSVGLQTNKESSDQIQATDLASLLISARRAAPTNVISGFALPALNVTSTTSNSTGVLLNLDGTTATVASAAPYRLNYVITPSTLGASKAVSLYLLLWWPGTASSAPTKSPGGSYQISTQIVLP